MQTISIRLDDNVITKIEALRGSEHKSDFYRKLIEHALNTFEHKGIQSDDKVITTDDKVITTDDKVITTDDKVITTDDKVITIEHKEDASESSGELLIELDLKDKIIEAKDQTIRTLESQNGFLIYEFQKMSSLNERLLMPSREEQKEKGKWFQFWK